MTPFIKKLNLALSLLCTLCTAYSYGDMDESSCTENTCCSPCQSQCGQILISADLLYWRPFQDRLDRCIPTSVSGTVLSDGRIISIFEGKGKDPRFEWNPGFRIGAGYEFACSNWDVGVLWTHFDSKAHRSFEHQNKLRWHIDLDVVDFLVAYQYDFNSCFILRPYIGVRGARIDQKVRFGGFPDSKTFALTDQNLFGTHNKHEFTGVGPLFGLEADLRVGCGFSLYVNGAISWLYGRNDVRLTDSTATTDVIEFCSIKNKTNSTLMAADASFGFRWQTCFCKDTQFFLQLGFEHHRYFDYSRIGDCGDLSFDGVRLGLGLGF